jgi:hypothetical protein
MKLSPRASTLLRLIAERHADGFKFYPHYKQWIREAHTHTCICNASDAGCLRGLERKGLLMQEGMSSYAFSITAAGLAQAAKEIGKPFKL